MLKSSGTNDDEILKLLSRKVKEWGTQLTN